MKYNSVYTTTKMKCQYQDKNGPCCDKPGEYQVTNDVLEKPFCLEHATYLARVSQRIDMQVQNIETRDITYN